MSITFSKKGNFGYDRNFRKIFTIKKPKIFIKNIFADSYLIFNTTYTCESSTWKVQIHAYKYTYIHIYWQIAVGLLMDFYIQNFYSRIYISI